LAPRPTHLKPKLKLETDMKFNFRKSFLAQLLFAVALIGLFAALALPARAQVTPTTIVALTNLPATVNAEAISNQVSIIPLTKNCGVSISGSFRCAAAGTSNIVWQIYPMYDGTNRTTTPWTVQFTNTTAVTNWVGVNYTKDQLAGIAALNLYGITNQNAGVAMTNYGIRYNRVSY
jgi:hypothetical protein